MIEAQITLDDVKDYIDETYGEYTGEIVVDAIQCDYKESSKDVLIFYMFHPEIDDMVEIGSIDGGWNVWGGVEYPTNLFDIGWEDNTDLNNVKAVVSLIFILLRDAYNMRAEECGWIGKEIHKIAKLEEKGEE